MLKIRWIEIRGFRGFGSSPQRLELASPLTLVWDPNSQGNTSFAEAFEFLLTGQTIRTALLGGAKTEFSDYLRNVYLPTGSEVYVSAGIGIEDNAGEAHEVKRVLLFQPPLAFRRIQPIRRTKRRLRLVPKKLRKMLHHVVNLVAATSLHRVVLAVHRINRRKQRLGAVNDKQPAPPRFHAPTNQVLQQRLTGCGILACAMPCTIPSTCL